MALERCPKPREGFHPSTLTTVSPGCLIVAHRTAMAGQQQNVGYAKTGAACLYNVDIMEETNAILACGAGAISKRVFADRELRIERAPNVTNVAVYIDRIDELIARKRALFA